MQKKQLELLIAVGLLFILTSGTSFLLCEKDIVLEYINRVGNWSNAILLKSTYVFVAYTLANSAYNINYILPKVVHSLFVIKYFDKLNGWLGFSSKGELERYLENAKQAYSPLYKDVIIGLNNNVGVPLYNNLWAPFFSVSDFKCEKSVKLEFRDRFIYLPILSRNDNNALEYNLNTIKYVQQQFYQKMLEAHKKSAKLFDDVLQLKGQPLYSLDFLSPFLSIDYYGQKLLVHNDNISVDSQGNEHITQYLHQLNADYPQAFVVQTIQLQNYDVDDITFSNRIDNWYLNIVGFATVPQTNFAAGYKPMAYYECSYEIPVVDIYYLTQNSGDFILFLKERPNEPVEIIIKNDNFFIDGYRGDITAAYDRAFTGLHEQIAQVHQETLSMSTQLTSLIAATVGLVGLATHHYDSINATNLISEAIINSSMGAELANVFLSHSQPVPEFLRQYTSLTNPQDYLLSGESLIDTNPLSALNDAPKANGSILPYIGTGVAILGAIGITWYLTKYGMDVSPVTETIKTFKETLQDKYTNFK